MGTARSRYSFGMDRDRASSSSSGSGQLSADDAANSSSSRAGPDRVGRGRSPAEGQNNARPLQPLIDMMMISVARQNNNTFILR